MTNNRLKRGFFKNYLNDLLNFADSCGMTEWRTLFEEKASADENGIIWITFPDEEDFWKLDMAFEDNTK